VKEDVKLHILLEGGNFLRSSWPLAVGECPKIGRNWWFWAHGTRYRHAMDMGVSASERARQITYSIRTLDFLEVMLASWCRGEGVSP
jgi:hypothetical protein